MVRRAVLLGLLLALLLGLPLFGVALKGEPVDPYLEFPPLTSQVEQPGFSWPVFIVLFVLIAAPLVPFTLMIAAAPAQPHVYLLRQRAFPWWGWMALAWLAVSWTLAWTRFSWFEDYQSYTFTPLWLGYIVAVNALTFKRTGHCLLIARPLHLAALVVSSAAFWWFFEYLNRFVHNWYYPGVEGLEQVAYVVHATVCFATVLPAVLSTIECLETYPRLAGSFRDLVAIDLPNPEGLGWLVLTVASVGLMGIAVWPEFLFPLLWVSPLLIVVALQAILGEETIFSGIVEGDWRRVWLPAIAGLICGFFWEMWNVHSLAHWVYQIPYVHAFQLFEMPLLGYAGYLPFGLECVVVAGLLPGGKQEA